METRGGGAMGSRMFRMVPTGPPALASPDGLPPQSSPDANEARRADRQCRRPLAFDMQCGQVTRSFLAIA